MPDQAQPVKYRWTKVSQRLLAERMAYHFWFENMQGLSTETEEKHIAKLLDNVNKKIEKYIIE